MEFALPVFFLEDFFSCLLFCFLLFLLFLMRGGADTISCSMICYDTIVYSRTVHGTAPVRG